MEYRIGMYVRTKEGEIHKIKSISNDYIEYENGYGIPSDLNDYISKASYNILLLLEPLDILYIDIDPNDGHSGIVVPRIAETLAELNEYKEAIKNGNWKLVGVVTHKQIEKIIFEIGGE